jgi:tetratricopeptide (TPR) repeat protein
MPLTASSKDLEDRKWIEVRTANFQIRSLMSADESVALARHLEVFGAVVSVLTGTDRLVSPVPTEIYLLSGSSAAKDFGMSARMAGYFRSGLRNNTMVVRDTVGMDENAIIMHEYVHFLTNIHSSVNYPLWYREGFAEYLSTIRIESNIVTVGRIPSDRMASFTRSTWIPVSRIISKNSYDEWNSAELHKVYAEAWGLVHYLKNRSDSDKPFAEQFRHYLAMLDSGEDSIEAFEEAFEISMGALNSRLRQYVYGDRVPGFSFAVDDLGIEVDPEVRELSREEISLALGQNALEIGEMKMAEKWFTIAASNDQNRPQAEAGLGDVLKFQDKFDDAEPHFENAIALAPDDKYCQLDFAEYWHDRAEKTEENDLQAVYLKRARKHYVNAWKIDDSMPEVYAMYGRTFIIDENYVKAIDMLEQAQQLLPSDIGVRLVLAEAYLGAQQLDDAIFTARSVIAQSHGSEEASERAQDVLDKASETTEP